MIPEHETSADASGGVLACCGDTLTPLLGIDSEYESSDAKIITVNDGGARSGCNVEAVSGYASSDAKTLSVMAAHQARQRPHLTAMATMRRLLACILRGAATSS